MNITIAGIAFTFVVLASPSAIAGKKPESKPYTQLAHVPAEDRTRANPLETDPGAVAAGRKLYERHCAGCHGATGESGRKGPSLLVPEIQAATSGELFWVITNGNVRSGMPVWSKLPEPQRWQITKYVMSLGSGQAP